MPFLLSAGVFIVDQITKLFIKEHLTLFEAIPVLPFFSIVYVENIGSAFGLFKSLGNIFFISVSVVAIVVLTVLVLKEQENRLSFSLILGGAAGNLTDRLAHGYVIDFLDIYIGRYHWPAFNVADSALTIGIILVAANALLPAGHSLNTKDGRDRP
ncbi:MAG: signal peptidase II [Nitrospirae bacterium]|nr:signal peptidase II [Nitrospirota bacterium]